MKICIDAGHYGKYNRSPVNGAYYESDMAWKLHQYLKAELEAYGVTVITTRSSQDKDLALMQRGQAAKGCDLFISVHSNACGDATEDHPLACCTVTGKADSIGQKLADAVAKTMKTKQKGRIWKKKGTYGNDWFTVLYGAASVGVPGVLMEHSFHTNKAATDWLLVEANLKKLAQAEAKTIAEHYGLTKNAQETAEADDKPYRIRKSKDDAASQIGAYSSLTNAIRAWKKGYVVYDKHGNVMYPNEKGNEFQVRVDIPDLNIRTGAGVQYPVTGRYTGKGVFTIVEVQNTWEN